ncbi:MAG: M16 family metallopeptidase [Phycisphaerales bacterium]
MPDVVVRTLACGMPLIVESMPGVRSVGVTWLIPAGSSTDPADKQGLCAMWSELLLRGAGDLDSHAQADAMDRLGITRGTDASTHHLRLSFTLLGSRLADALPIITDMVLRPQMDEDAVGPSRDLAIQSIESLADDPQQRAVLTLRELHNPPPFNRSGLGTVECLNAITRDDLVDGWRRQARPQGSILAVAGDVGPAGGTDGLAESLDRLLGGWSGSPPPITTGSAARRGGYLHVDDKTAQVQIVLMHDAPPERSEDSRLERVVASVLSGGMSARLFTEVREKRGLCYSVSESYAADRDWGRCMAYVGTTPERAQESLDVLLSELERINTPAGTVTEDEFVRAQIGIKSGLIMSGESTAARAAALAGDQFRIGRPRTLDEVAARYASVTLDEVRGYLARRKLGPTTIVTLGKTSLKRA